MSRPQPILPLLFGDPPIPEGDQNHRATLRAAAARAWERWHATRDPGVPLVEHDMLGALPPGWWWSELMPRAYPPSPLGDPAIGMVVEVTQKTYPGPARPGIATPSHDRSCKAGFRVVIGRRWYGVGLGIIWASVERDSGGGVCLRGGANTTGSNWRLMAGANRKGQSILRRVALVDFPWRTDEKLAKCGVIRPEASRDELQGRVAVELAEIAGELNPRRYNQRHDRP